MMESDEVCPMISWSTNQGAVEPPADGKSALGLVEYYNGIPFGDSYFVAKVEADQGMMPIGAVSHYNITVNHWGLVTVDIKWRVQLWKEDHTATDKMLFDANLTYPFLEWETHNEASDPNEPWDNPDASQACPRAFTGLMADPWTKTAIWNSDGNHESVCDDAMRYSGAGEEGQLIGSFDDDGKTYNVLLSGFYECAESTGTEVYHPLTGCTLKDTFWDPEFDINTAYVMISVHEVPQLGNEGCTPGYWGNESNNTVLGHNWPEGYTPDMNLTEAFGLAGGGNEDAKICTVNKGACHKDPSLEKSIYDVTLGEALNSQGGTWGQLGFHGTAALFNAAELNYFVTLDQVKTLFACAISDDSVEEEDCDALGYEKGDASEIFGQFARWNEDGDCVDRKSVV